MFLLLISHFIIVYHCLSCMVRKKLEKLEKNGKIKQVSRRIF